MRSQPPLHPCRSTQEFQLPPLPFKKEETEPVISAHTNTLHHDGARARVRAWQGLYARVCSMMYCVGVVRPCVHAVCGEPQLHVDYVPLPRTDALSTLPGIPGRPPRGLREQAEHSNRRWVRIQAFVHTPSTLSLLASPLQGTK